MQHNNSEKLHICMLSSAISTMHGTKDVRIYWKDGCTLRDAGHKISIVLMCNDEPPKGEKNITWEFVPKPKNRFIRVLASVRLLKRALKHKYDVYHIYDGEILWFSIFLRLFRPSRKTIYVAREPLEIYISIKHWVPKLLRKPFRLSVRLYEYIFSKFCDAVITVAPSNNEKFERWGRNSCLVQNFPINYSDIEFIPWQDREKIILYLGQISLRREIKQLLSIANFLHNNPDVGYKIRIVGKYHPGDEGEIKPILAKFPADTFELRLEWIDYPDAMKEVAASRFGLFFYNKEFLAQVANTTVNKIYEYMLYGAIPIVTFIPEMQKYITDLETGIFLPPGKEAQKLSEIFVTIEQKGNIISKNTREFAMKNFIWDSEKEKLLLLYRNLIPS